VSRVKLVKPLPYSLEGKSLVIAAVTDDSRLVEAGDLFLLLPSAGARALDAAADGYVEQALARGAQAVVSVGAGLALCEGMMVPHLPFLTMEEAGQWLRRVLAFNIQDDIACIGITGTDGKTSITWMLREALQRLHGESWSLGTLGKITGDGDALPLANTTPSLLTMHQTVAEASAKQVASLVCEVSSHGIAQQRIAGVPFLAALWSNVGSDHLQVHGGMDRYVALKASFLRRVVDRGGVAIANGDQPQVVAALHEMQARVFWYGRELGDHCPDHHLCWRSLASDRVALQMGDETQVITGAPVAEFHHENLAAAAAVLLHGALASLAQLPELLSNIRVPLGRMEPVVDGVFIDYAHTPEALAALLASARKLCSGRLLLVFGCGGDRDHSKRAQMGAIAAGGADLIWVTEDNSRSESAQAIADAVVAGIGEKAKHYSVELDRGAAIAAALRTKEHDDVLLIAGKGHEDYIERDGVRTPWSDAKCVRHALAMDKANRACG